MVCPCANSLISRESSMMLADYYFIFPLADKRLAKVKTRNINAAKSSFAG